MTFADWSERFHARRVGGNYVAKCPVHRDGDAPEKWSLSLSDKGDRILVNCFAGCETKDVLTTMGMSFADLFPNGAKSNASQKDKAVPRIVQTYDYTDEAGTLLYQVVRYDPKAFKQRRPDGKGGWIWSLDGVRLVPYNLQEALKADSVLVVEGERDVATARNMGLIGTCNAMGASKWRDEYSECLRGKNVTIIPDSDEPGRKHAEQVARSLFGKAASVAICHLPEGAGKDISDWKLSRESLIELIKKAPSWTPETEKRMESYSVSDLFSAREQSVNFLVWPVLAPGLAVVVDALPKDGKSVLLFRGILAARRNKPFLGYATHPARVLYVSEQSRASLGMQLRECGYDGSEPIEELRFLTREIWSRYVFDDFVRIVEKDFLPGGYNAIVWDTLATIARLEDEKDAAEINRCANLILDVASRHSLATCIGRHDRKSGGDIGVSGRGSGQLSGLVDLILHLTRIPGADFQRKLETRGRIPGLPTILKIELTPSGEYVNWGEPVRENKSNQDRVNEWVKENPDIDGPDVVAKFAALTPSVEVSLRTAQRYISDTPDRRKATK